jgi:hypothetical protein
MLIWLVDGVLLVAVLEGAWLMHRARRAGLPRLPLAANLCAGLALMCALRGVLGDAPGGWMVTCLTIAGLAHAVDMRARWRSAQPNTLQPTSHR